MRMTEEQRRAVEARGKVVVSASAGSGKTFVMIERLVSLVLGGEHVLEMLAVTFTNKAAAQLRERLRLALIEKVRTTAGETQRRLMKELSDLPLMDVSTIHAFCGRLVRSHFYLAGVDPAFTILSADSPAGQQLAARAMDEVFEAAYRENSPAFRLALSVFFRKHKDRALRTAVSRLHRAALDSVDPRATLARVGEDGFGRAGEALAAQFRTRAKNALSRLEKLSFLAESVPRAEKLLSLLDELLQAVATSQTLFEASRRMREASADWVSTPSRKGKPDDVAAALGELSAVRAETKSIADALSSFGEEALERSRTDRANELARALASLALAYDEAFSRLKRENNVLDYGDLERLALAVLSDGAARAEIASRYKFVCVDEYQDVNPVQERILSAVSGDEVFLVGDEKQAIYGFRGSRSEFFAEKERELGGSLPLTRNFRSADAVLEAVNTVFSPIFGKRYAPVAGDGRYGEHRGAVELHMLREAEKKEERVRDVYSVVGCPRRKTVSALAEKIADIVEREVGSLWYDADAGKEKPIAFGDIAVLARQHSGDAERVGEALAARGIPVSATDKINLCDTYEARLLIDVMSWLDNAEQDIPLVTALVSLGGFTERELAAVRTARPAPYTFREACADYCREETGLAARLKRFFGRAEELRALAQIRGAAEMGQLLLTEGLETVIAAKEDGEKRLAHVRRLLAEAEGCANIHAFLARLKAASYRFEITEDGGGNAVRILTMHAAKGLEFPVVILASLDTAFRTGKDTDIFWSDAYLASPYCYDTESKKYTETVTRRAAALARREDDLAGERNLLYVAMTRARYRLHLVAAERERAFSPENATRLSDFIDFSACAKYIVTDAEEKKPAVRPPVVGKEDGAAARIVSVFGVPYAHSESVLLPAKSSATAILQSGAEQRAFRGGGEGKSVEEGLAYHAFLQYVEFGKDAAPELARMRVQGLLSEERAALLSVEKLGEILRIPCLTKLAGKRLYRERKFLVSLPACEVMETSATDEILLQGAIDLLVEDEEGYLVIDYKFSSHDDERLRTDYAPQIAVYRKAVAKILRVKESSVRARIVNIAACREIVV